MYEVTVERTFVATHALRHYRGGTEPLHAHEWRVWITVAGATLDPAGCAVDFAELAAWFERAVAAWRDRDLNTVPPFDGAVSPSAENVARVLYERIAPAVPADVTLVKVEVEEEVGCRAAYRPAPVPAG